MTSQEILNFLRTALAENQSKEDIYLRLLNEGCKIQEIETALEEAGSSKEKAEIGRKAVKVFVLIGALMV